jgi:hypothetical protein
MYMPTYEYYCDSNDQTIEVLHGMEDTISTWGELCECAGLGLGETPVHASVERKLSAVSLLPKKDFGGTSGGCCGGGCGCSGH